MSEWCNHCYKSKSFLSVKGYFWNSQLIDEDWGWMFCPICGAPRPKEESLRERLARELCESYWDKGPWEILDKQGKKRWFTFADTAIRILGEK